MYAESLGCMYADFGCMSMEQLGAKYKEVVCIYTEICGCMYADFGCMSMDRLGACMRKRLGAKYAAVELPIELPIAYCLLPIELSIELPWLGGPRVLGRTGLVLAWGAVRQAFSRYETCYLLSGRLSAVMKLAPNNRILCTQTFDRHAPNNRIHAPNRSIDMHPKDIDFASKRHRFRTQK